MRISVIVSILASTLALSTLVGRAEDRTPDQIKAAKEFAVEGIGFGVNPQTIRVKWPNVKRVAESSDSKIAWETLRVPDTTNTDGIDFEFLEGKLVSMVVWYFPDRVSRMGGWEILPERIQGKLGLADSLEKADAEIFRADWVIPEANRFVRLVVENKKAFMVITDRDAKEQVIHKKQSSASTGF